MADFASRSARNALAVRIAGAQLWPKWPWHSMARVSTKMEATGTTGVI